MVRKALTSTQKKAAKSPTAATAVIEGLNEKVAEQREQIKVLEANLTDIQDQYSTLEEKYHKMDKRNGILLVINTYSLGFEIIKFIVSAVGTAVGVNIATNGNAMGWFIVAVAILAYILIAVWQVKGNSKSELI